MGRSIDTMDVLSFIIPRSLFRTCSPYNKDIDVINWKGKRMLYANGIQQSGHYTVKLWKRACGELQLMLPEAQTILVLGVGGGTVFPLLRSLYPAAAITGVDIDKEILRVAKQYFASHVSAAGILDASDARDWVVRAKKIKKRFDCIIVDLYIGNDVPTFVAEKPFLANLARILAPRGIVAINYFSSAEHKKRSKVLFDRLVRTYHSVTRRDVYCNTFFFCS